MKRILFFLFILFTVNSYSQNWGIGLRLGDPTGFTFKKYFGSNALEISIGRTDVFMGNYWYNNQFDTWYNNQKFGYYGYALDAYKVTPLGLQIHYLFNKHIKNIGDWDITNLDWYFGFGGQMRFLQYSYEYDYQTANNAPWNTETDHVTEVDLGVDGAIGLEYKFPKAPFAVFADFTLAMELVPNPFIPWGQFGIGARYDF